MPEYTEAADVLRALDKGIALLESNRDDRDIYFLCANCLKEFKQSLTLRGMSDGVTSGC